MPSSSSDGSSARDGNDTAGTVDRADAHDLLAQPLSRLLRIDDDIHCRNRPEPRVHEAGKPSQRSRGGGRVPEPDTLDRAAERPVRSGGTCNRLEIGQRCGVGRPPPAPGQAPLNELLVLCTRPPQALDDPGAQVPETRHFNDGDRMR